MSLMHFRYDPFSEFDRLFEDAFSSRFLRPVTGPSSESTRDVFRPRYVVNDPCPVSLADVVGCRMDVHEDAESNTVTATFDLPGFTSEQVNIDVNQDRLTISGEASSSQQRDERGYTVRERSCGRFSRTLILPQGTKVSYGDLLSCFV